MAYGRRRGRFRGGFRRGRRSFGRGRRRFGGQRRMLRIGNRM